MRGWALCASRSLLPWEASAIIDMTTGLPHGLEPVPSGLQEDWALKSTLPTGEAQGPKLV